MFCNLSLVFTSVNYSVVLLWLISLSQISLQIIKLSSGFGRSLLFTFAFINCWYTFFISCCYSLLVFYCSVQSCIFWFFSALACSICFNPPRGIFIPFFLILYLYSSLWYFFFFLIYPLFFLSMIYVSASQ